jgi:hypothetical protein
LIAPFVKAESHSLAGSAATAKSRDAIGLAARLALSVLNKPFSAEADNGKAVVNPNHKPVANLHLKSSIILILTIKSYPK